MLTVLDEYTHMHRFVLRMEECTCTRPSYLVDHLDLGYLYIYLCNEEGEKNMSHSYVPC